MPTPLHVLILEDRPADAELILHHLRQAGFEPDWQRVETEQDYLSALSPDLELILADYTLPQFDAPRALNLLQGRGLDIPFIIITGSISEEVAVECIKQGAADYLLKDRLTRLGQAVSHALDQKLLREEKRQADRALRESEKRFRALIEHGRDNISLLTAEGILQWESPSSTTTLGYAPDEFVGHNIFELMHPDDQEWTRPLFTQVYQTPGSTQDGIFRMRHSDGSWRWIEATATNLLNEPSVQAIIINYRDITGRKQAEEAVVAGQKRFQALIEHAPDGISLLGSDGRLLQITPSTQKILGYVPEDVEGQNPAVLTHPEDLPDLLLLLNDLMQNPGKVATTQYRFRHKDGSWRWLESTISNLVAEPSVGAIVFNYRDITERKQASRVQEILYQVLREVSRQLDLDLVAHSAVETLVRLSGHPHVCVALPDESGAYWVVRGAAGSLAAELGATYPIHQGVIGRAFKTGQTQWVRDILDDPGYVRDVSAADAPALRSEVVALMRRGDQVLGALNIESDHVNAFNSAEVRMTESLAEVVGLALQNARLYKEAQQEITNRKVAEEKIRQQLEHLTALSEIDRAITSSFDLHLSLGTLLTQVIAQLGVDAADILLFNPDLLLLEFFAGSGFRTKAFELGHPLRVGDGYAGRVVMERTDIHVSDLAAQEDNPRLARALKGEAFTDYFGVPLISKGKVKGVLEIFHRAPLEPDQDWLDFLHTLAGQAAIAIDNLTLFDDLQRTNSELMLAYETTLEGWSHALDLRDKETEGHTQRVTEMTTSLARDMGMTNMQLLNIRRGSLLHDIGKMGVPDNILLKPGELTEEEWKQMRMHPVYAYDMLSHIAYLHEALDIPYCHHEKWDGTGYPRGLKGEEIPLAARIFAVVDVWDALRSDRPYRQAWSDEKARKHIREQAGAYFDPKVVEAFMRWTSPGMDERKK